jgi:hypothetical protein
VGWEQGEVEFACQQSHLLRRDHEQRNRALGHGSLATTMRYLGVNEDDISTAILGAPVGHQGRSVASREDEALFSEFLAWKATREAMTA